MPVSVLKALAVATGFVAVFLAVWHGRRPRGVPLEEEWKARPGSYGERGPLLLYVLLGTAACFLGAYGVTGRLHLAVLASFGGFFVGRAFERARQNRRRALLRSQYAQVVGSLMAALQGGLSPYQALEDAVPSMPRPARDVFAEILRRTRTGSTYVEAVKGVAEETGWRDLESLVVALRIYSRTGCNLAEVFKHLQESVVERESDRRYVAAVTAETRITARLLSFLPFFLMGVSRVLAPEFVSPLFDTLPGNILIAVVTALVLVGNAVTARMVRAVVGDEV
ncbi:type II secretion system F family protein [Desulfovirgula thermocuniculi]|uniref:type II secretion system F family protein n=1 Tax=Desulfovirgula thermocuniculi TaxID=348842 RepID=UPI0004101400|nr:type II secretion system F family protein [Desulfovirgula thermocuniculi]